jgi:hypothetical protein
MVVSMLCVFMLCVCVSMCWMCVGCVQRASYVCVLSERVCVRIEKVELLRYFDEQLRRSRLDECSGGEAAR